MVFKLRFVSNQKDWEGLLAWVNDYRKKHSRSLFRRVKAATKKAVKGGGKQRLTFQYDPSSYALNFDDGSGDLEGQINAFQWTHVGDSPTNRNYTWVYVVRVKAY